MLSLPLRDKYMMISVASQISPSLPMHISTMYFLGPQREPDSTLVLLPLTLRQRYKLNTWLWISWHGILTQVMNLAFIDGFQA